VIVEPVVPSRARTPIVGHVCCRLATVNLVDELVAGDVSWPGTARAATPEPNSDDELAGCEPS